MTDAKQCMQNISIYQRYAANCTNVINI